MTVFRGAYEQIGNTVALWADSGIDRHVGIGADPDDLVPVAESAAGHPDDAAAARLLAARIEAGGSDSAMRTHGAGCLHRRRCVSAAGRGLGIRGRKGRASWLWLVLFFFVFTLGELYILPTGLGLFARLAPSGLGATTWPPGSWPIFSGSLAAGAVGTLWSHIGHAAFFCLLALVAAMSGIFLLALDRPARRIDVVRGC